MRKWWIVPVVAVGVLACFLAWRHYSVRETTDDAQIDGHINPVAARVSGPVVAVLIRDNQHVKAGDILVRIDPRDYEVALAKARADLAQAEAARFGAATDVPLTHSSTSSNLDVASSDTGVANARVEAARARIREAEANAARAAADLERIKVLVDKDEVSRQEYDARVADAAAARATVDSAKAAEHEAAKGVESAGARLSQARTAPQQVAVVKARFAEAEARVAESKAKVEEAELNLAYTTLRAPVDGVVSRRGVEVGQMIVSGQPLLALVDLDERLGDRELQGKPGRAHEARPGGGDLRRCLRRPVFHGRIDSVAAATGASFSLLPPENATGNFVKVVQRVPVKIAFERSDRPRPHASPRPLRRPHRAAPVQRHGGRRSTHRERPSSIRGSWPWRSCSPRSWRSSTRRSSTCPFPTSRAASRQPSTNPRGPSRPTWSRTRSSCR